MWGVNRKLFHVKPVVTVSVFFLFLSIFFQLWFDDVVATAAAVFSRYAVISHVRIMCDLLMYVFFLRHPFHLLNQTVYVTIIDFFSFRSFTCAIFVIIFVRSAVYTLLIAIHCCSFSTSHSSSFLCSLTMEWSYFHIVQFFRQFFFTFILWFCSKFFRDFFYAVVSFTWIRFFYS